MSGFGINEEEDGKMGGAKRAIQEAAKKKMISQEMQSATGINTGVVEKGLKDGKVGGSPLFDTSGTTKEGDLKREAAKQGMQALGLDGALGGAGEGAIAGSKFGVKGAIIGGIIGGVAGGLGASAKQKAAYKAAKAKAAAEHHGKLELIEKEKDRKIQGALESMKGAFSRNLQNNKQVKL